MEGHDSGPGSLLGHPVMLPKNKDASHHTCMCLGCPQGVPHSQEYTGEPQINTISAKSNDVQGFGN